MPSTPQKTCAAIVESGNHYLGNHYLGALKHNQPVPQVRATARNLALNLYRDLGFDNMAQAQRRLNQLKAIFRVK
ncbi:MAG: hypothetical protein IGS38_21485 [Synechococcales cyanobacterium M58_A2018_015]|nr:hypothetical protein [Synechococcales cyanobacterium M58_A2018_015]